MAKRGIKHGAHWKQSNHLISWTVVKRRPKYKIYVPLKEVAEERENFPVMLSINKSTLESNGYGKYHPLFTYHSNHITLHWSGFPQRHNQVCEKKSWKATSLFSHDLQIIYMCLLRLWSQREFLPHWRAASKIFLLLYFFSLTHYLCSLIPCTRNLQEPKKEEWKKEK